MMEPTPPAGWYPDPSGKAELQYFDGNSWTGQMWPMVTQPPFPAPHQQASRSSVHRKWMWAVNFGIGVVVFQLVRLIFGHGSPNSSTPADVVPAISGTSNSDNYLQTLRGEYFAKQFSDDQLLAEGRKVCEVSAKSTDGALVAMVRSDLGVSDTAAASIVEAAKGGLGC